MESPWGALQTITGPGILIHSVYNQPEPLSLQSSLILPRCTHFGIIVAFNNRQGLPWWCRGWEGFPGSSASKVSACNAGDPSSIPGLERSPGEGIGDSLQYSWASLVAQMVKNLPAMQETWVRFLSQEKKMATHSSVLAWESPWTEELGYSPWDHKELDTTE